MDNAARQRAGETKRERTIQAITNAVMTLDATERDVTYAAVAEIAGVSESTVYRYFPTKDELIGHPWGEGGQGVQVPTDVAIIQLTFLIKKDSERSDFLKRVVNGVLKRREMSRSDVAELILTELLR